MIVEYLGKLKERDAREFEVHEEIFDRFNDRFFELLIETVRAKRRIRNEDFQMNEKEKGETRSLEELQKEINEMKEKVKEKSFENKVHKKAT